MIKKLILTDVDGCLVSWEQGFIEFMENYGIPQNPGKENSFLINERFNCSASKSYSLMDEYATSEYIAKLNPINNSVAVVKRLKEKGYEFIAITSLGTDPKSYEYRWNNLTNLYGDAFSRLIMLSGGSGKYDTLSQFIGQSDIWVEDQLKNAIDGADLGFQSFLMTQMHNDKPIFDERIIRVNTWNEIEDWITNQENE
jgi:uncharacterized HAD superfamily protein